MLVLEIILTDLVLCNDGREGTLRGDGLGTRTAVDGGEGDQDREGVAGAVHI
jgi:hypothetical protein